MSTSVENKLAKPCDDEDFDNVVTLQNCTQLQTHRTHGTIGTLLGALWTLSVDTEGSADDGTLLTLQILRILAIQ